MFFFVRKINSFLFVGFEFWQGYHAISCGQFPFSLHLKDLQRQLGCKNGLLIAKKLELEKAKVSEHEEIGVCMVPESSKH
ncbi:hypothetical protein Hanom_Chr14g01262781 [Helianthus anomalus]